MFNRRLIEVTPANINIIDLCNFAVKNTKTQNFSVLKQVEPGQRADTKKIPLKTRSPKVLHSKGANNGNKSF